MKSGPLVQSPGIYGNMVLDINICLYKADFHNNLLNNTPVLKAKLLPCEHLSRLNVSLVKH